MKKKNNMAIPFYEENNYGRTSNRNDQIALSQCTVNIRIIHENVDTSRDRSTDIPKYFFGFLVIILFCKMTMSIK